MVQAMYLRWQQSICERIVTMIKFRICSVYATSVAEQILQEPQTRSEFSVDAQSLTDA